MRDMEDAKRRLPSCSHTTLKSGLRDLCFISLVKRQTRSDLTAAYDSLNVSYKDDRAKVIVVTRLQTVAMDIQIRDKLTSPERSAALGDLTQQGIRVNFLSLDFSKIWEKKKKPLQPVVV